MSLSDDLRNELAAIAPRRRCDRLAELSGLFHAAGSVNLRGRGELSVQLDVGSSAVARRAFSLVRAFGVGAEIRTYRRRAFDKGTRYQLRIEGDEQARAVLREAGVLDAAGRPLERPPKRVVGRSCCRGAYLRGALLGGGSLSGPRDPHLELRTAGESGARFLASVAAAEGVTLAVAERGNHAVAYAKGAEAIADLVGTAGASDLVLALQEHAVVAATRAGANRLANADHANLVRASRAAHAQLETVRRLQSDGTLERLSPQLRELAELRLRHPTLSLRELALRCRPPATKSAAFRRFRRLKQIAERS